MTRPRLVNFSYPQSLNAFEVVWDFTASSVPLLYLKLVSHKREWAEGDAKSLFSSLINSFLPRRRKQAAAIMNEWRSLTISKQNITHLRWGGEGKRKVGRAREKGINRMEANKNGNSREFLSLKNNHPRLSFSQSLTTTVPSLSLCKRNLKTQQKTKTSHKSGELCPR